MKSRLVFSLIVLFGLLALALAPALAHEQRDVGPYEFTFGWRVEPAYAGVVNGPELFIRTLDGYTPVEGAEQSLSLQVEFGGRTKTLLLSPVFADPGHHTADLLPTRPGDYTFHIIGTVAETT